MGIAKPALSCRRAPPLLRELDFGRVRCAHHGAWNAPYAGLRSTHLRELNPMVPITRLTMTVHHCDNKNMIVLNGVQHGIRKNSGQISMHVTFHHPPCFRRCNNLINGRLHSGDKAGAQTEASSLRLIENCGILKLKQSLRMELISHLLIAALTWAKTASPGIGVTLPLRTSSTRRRASFTHS